MTFGGLGRRLGHFPVHPHEGPMLYGDNHSALATNATATRRNPIMQMSLQTVSRLLGVRPHRIEYCLSNQLVPEPKVRLAGKRVFASEDLARLAEYFGVTLPTEGAESVAEPIGA
jgi:hypothetical protein